MNNELLQAISDMMDKKLEPVIAKVDTLDTNVNTLTANVNTLAAEIRTINGRLDRIEQRLDVIEFKQERTEKKLNDLQLNVELFERDIKRDIHTLRDEMDTVIELLKIHKIMPV